MDLSSRTEVQASSLEETASSMEELAATVSQNATSAQEASKLAGSASSIATDAGKAVAEVGATMEEISRSARLNSIVGEIALAGQEQSDGIQQVNQAVLQMDHVTQQNSALVEEAAAATASLNEQATRLSHAVAVFNMSAGAKAAKRQQPALAKAQPVSMAASRQARLARDNGYRPAVVRRSA